MLRVPVGFVAGAAERVRRAGGLFIADEVQTGFGRLGLEMWGFATHGVAPDLVTLGKPMGNGYPLASVIVRAPVLEPFANAGRYFNTFGGNPVSAAVGLAVLDTFEEEGLLRNSLETGAYLHRQLEGIAARAELVGDVRGSGLFAGVELVSDRGTREPATSAAHCTVNLMRESGVLISAIGPASNVLKIRPPLPFQRHHVDQLVATLEESLSLCRSNQGSKVSP